ncbi:MAG: chemotaxis-specific protein-glutamate methyltransferase CheB [Acidobacteriota bacterium]
MIKVLVVDDSRIVAEFLKHLLSSEPDVQVVGIASNGEEGLRMAQESKPDVITMDIHMPKVNGFEATRKIMETCPTPIVIVSGSTSQDEVATNFRAVEAGALTVIARPRGQGHPLHEADARGFVETVKLMSEVRVIRRWPQAKTEPRVAQTLANRPRRVEKPRGGVAVVAIGASTGGPMALQTILSRLPRDFAVPVLIVQHMARGFAKGFAEWLTQSTGFSTEVATAGQQLLPARAYVAPDDFHMGVGAQGHILLASDEQENGTRPSVSFLFRSVATAFGAGAVGVLLTGMGRDGAEELKRLRERGAVTIAQDEQSSVVYGMPGEAIRIGAAAHVLPPEAIAATLALLVENSSGKMMHSDEQRG